MRYTCGILSGIALLYMLVAPPVLTWFYDPDGLWINAGFGIFMGVVAGCLYLLARGLDARAFSEGISRRPAVKFVIAWGMRSTYLLGAIILLLLSLGFMLSLIAGVVVIAQVSSLPGLVDWRMILYITLRAGLMAPATALSALCFAWFAVRGQIPSRRSIA